MRTVFITGSFLLVLLTVLVFVTPLIPNIQTYREMSTVAHQLGTPNAIHQYVVQKTTYEPLTFPRDIDEYWVDRVGDCTEIAFTEMYMLWSIGMTDAYVQSGYKNGTKHHYVVINGQPAYEHDVTPWYAN